MEIDVAGTLWFVDTPHPPAWRPNSAWQSITPSELPGSPPELEAKKVIGGVIRRSRRGRVTIAAETNSLIYIGAPATLKLVRSEVE